MIWGQERGGAQGPPTGAPTPGDGVPTPDDGVGGAPPACRVYLLCRRSDTLISGNHCFVLYRETDPAGKSHLEIYSGSSNPQNSLGVETRLPLQGYLMGHYLDSQAETATPIPPGHTETLVRDYESAKAFSGWLDGKNPRPENLIYQRCSEPCEPGKTKTAMRKATTLINRHDIEYSALGPNSNSFAGTVFRRGCPGQLVPPTAVAIDTDLIVLDFPQFRPWPERAGRGWSTRTGAPDIR